MDSNQVKEIVSICLNNKDAMIEILEKSLKQDSIEIKNLKQAVWHLFQEIETQVGYGKVYRVLPEACHSAIKRVVEEME